METVMCVIIVVGSALGTVAFIWCGIRADSAEAKVRYKDGQLQVKKDGKWECYDGEIRGQRDKMKERFSKWLDKERDDLLTKIHANHEPTWKFLHDYIDRHPGTDGIVYPSHRFVFKCSKCDFKKIFFEGELTPSMKNALIKLGLLDKPKKAR